MAQQIQIRRGTAAQWNTANPILAQGEMGLETDTNQFKMGDGISNWVALSYGGLQGPPQTLVMEDYGTGQDGDLVLTSGVVTLNQDTFYNNLTISGTGSINTNGYRLFVKEVLDISAAPANAITRPSSSGSNATTQAGVAGGPNISTSNTVGGGVAGGTGATGVVGVGVQAGAATSVAGSNGGAGGAGAAGGTGVSGAGGISRAGGTSTLPVVYARFTLEFLRGITLMGGGAAGAGGSSGAGDGTVLGRGGGGGGAGNGIIAIYARNINRSSSTAQGAISCNGGNGGNGANGATGNIGGGGGAGGGGGGYIYIAYETLIGTTATNCITVNGGNGGNGGNGFGTGTGAAGGTGGSSGRIHIYQSTTCTGQGYPTAAGAAGNPASGLTGGTGGNGGITQSNL